MNEFECYSTYTALKLHFTTDYDYFKYNGKHNASVASFEKRTDKRFFKRLAKRNINIVEYYVANLIDGKESITKLLLYVHTFIFPITYSYFCYHSVMCFICYQ